MEYSFPRGVSEGNLIPRCLYCKGNFFRLTIQTRETTGDIGLLGWSCLYKRFCPSLAALVGPVQNIFLIAEQAGLAVVPGPQSFSMCLCFEPSHQ